MKVKNSNWKERFFTAEEIGHMEAVFNENFFEHIKKDENIYIEGYYGDNSCNAIFTLKNQNESYCYPVEIKVCESDNPELGQDDAKTAILDFALEYFEEYFLNDRELYLTIEWSPFEVGDIRLYAKGQILNKKLENMADDILSSAGFDDCDDKND